MITVEQVIGYLEGKLESLNTDNGYDCIVKKAYSDVLNYIKNNRESAKYLEN